jgi:hypothetical protein
MDAIFEVGHEKKRYHVNRDLLSKHSDIFRKTFGRSQKKSQTGFIALHDIEANAFNLFERWLCTQALPIDDEDWHRGAEQNEWNEPDDPPDMLQIKLYVLANRLKVPSLRKALNREIVNDPIAGQKVALWWYDTIKYAFENLPATDPILDLIVDRHYAV